MSSTRRRPSTPVVLVSILLVSLLLAGVASSWAASTPDGLTKVSQDQGFAASETGHAAGEGPFAGYEASFLDGDRLSTGAAGVVGVLVVLLLGTGLALVVRRRPGRPDDATDDEGSEPSRPTQPQDV